MAKQVPEQIQAQKNKIDANHHNDPQGGQSRTVSEFCKLCVCVCVCVCVCEKVTELEWTGQVCDVIGKKPECVAPHASV